MLCEHNGEPSFIPRRLEWLYLVSASKGHRTRMVFVRFITKDSGFGIDSSLPGVGLCEEGELLRSTLELSVDFVGTSVRFPH